MGCGAIPGHRDGSDCTAWSFASVVTTPTRRSAINLFEACSADSCFWATISTPTKSRRAITTGCCGRPSRWLRRPNRGASSRQQRGEDGGPLSRWPRAVRCRAEDRPRPADGLAGRPIPRYPACGVWSADGCHGPSRTATPARLAEAFLDDAEQSPGGPWSPDPFTTRRCAILTMRASADDSRR
jgi:hypothetical protein